MYDIGIENGILYLNGEFRKLNLYVKEDKIAVVTPECLKSNQKIDADGKFILPGFIDPHVHFALGVGKSISKDDFYTGSQEAVMGGITTYIDFLDPVKRASEIKERFEERKMMAKQSLVDYAFHTTIANPTDCAQDLIHASKEVGISSIKLFTAYANTDRRTYDDYIYELLKASDQQNVRIVVHAENEELIDKRKHILVKDHERSRQVLTENVEVFKLAQIARETKGNLYIVHVSAGSSILLLKKNFEQELVSKKIVLESCPHYFLLNSSMLSKEDGYKYTMTPPIRPEHERKLLSELVKEVRIIGTDHCPYTKEQKQHTYTSEIPMGIGGIRYSFLNMYTQFGFSILDKFTKEPASIYQLENKGALLPGYDADIVIFDTKQTTKIQDEMSVYDKEVKKGKIDMVLTRGKICVKDGRIEEKSLQGKYIQRIGK